MNEQLPPVAEEPKKKNTTLWIIVGIVVLLCFCCVGAYIFYQYLGDPILKALGLQ